MFAAVFLLFPWSAEMAYAPPPPDGPPPLSDLGRFPSEAEVSHGYCRACSRIHRLDDMVLLYNRDSHPEEHAYWTARREEAYAERMFWSLLYDARNDVHSTLWRRDALGQLRTFIGPAAYARGWTPPIREAGR